MNLNNITQTYEEEGIKFKSALQFLTDTRNAEKEAEAKRRKRKFIPKEFFSFDYGKPLLPQIKKALKDVARKDYFEYVQYLREGANIKKLTKALTKAPKGRNSKANSQEHNNFMQYLYLLLCDCGVVNKYLTEGEQEGTREIYINGQVAGYGLSPAERESRLFGRIEKSKLLWDVISARALIMAGEVTEKMLQGVVINDLAIINSKGNKTTQYSISKDKNVTEYIFTNGLKIYVDGELDIFTCKVLLIALSKLYKNVPNNILTSKKTLDDFIKYSTVSITSEEYMEITQKKNIDKARQALYKGAKTLFESVIDSNKKKALPDFNSERWISGAKCENGIAEVTFANKTMKYFCSKKVKEHDFNMVLLTVDDKQVVTFQLGYKLWLQYMMRQGEDGDNRLTIKGLLDTITELPRVEHIMRSRQDKHTARIRERFETALDNLVNIGYLKSWRYTKAKGEPITDEEKDNATFSEWQEWLLSYELRLPAQGKYIEAKRKMVEARKRRKIAKENKAASTPVQD